MLRLQIKKSSGQALTEFSLSCGAFFAVSVLVFSMDVTRNKVLSRFRESFEKMQIVAATPFCDFQNLEEIKYTKAIVHEK